MKRAVKQQFFAILMMVALLLSFAGQAFAAEAQESIQAVFAEIGEDETEVSVLEIQEDFTDTEEVEVDIQQEVHVHVSVPYPEIVPTIVSEGRTGGTYCSECGEELTAPTPVPALALTQELSRGATGNDVLAAQQKLAALGYLLTGPDGDYGNYTAVAVKLFQAANGLTTDGQVGPYTAAVMAGTPVAFYPLSYGMDNSVTALLQESLISQGFLTGGADGYFGDQTYEALRRFQFVNNLEVTGQADIATLTVLLLGDNTQGRNLSLGASGYDVIAVQDRLAELGFYQGPSNGSYDGATQAAVKLFQLYCGISDPDGEVGNWTFSLLMNRAASFYPVTIWSDGLVVQVMQQYLQEKGFLNSDADGYFGNITRNALLDFQAANALTETGEGDIATLQLLFDPGTNSRRDLARNDQGSDVYALQKRLKELGYLDAEPTGEFGTRTYAAVCAFQAAQGIADVDGIVGSWTMYLLQQATESFHPVDAYSSYAEIYAIQKVLVRKGLLSYADGYFGDSTQFAVLELQNKCGLAQTGVVDLETMVKLYDATTTAIFIDNKIQGYYSATNWLIYVNTTTNRMYVYYGYYGHWSLVYDWDCTTGHPDTPTVLGEFTTSFKGYSFGGETYTCYYFTSFYGPYYIHSPLFVRGTFDYLDPRLGYNLSHGCVRIALENAIWVYNNIPYGTKVVVVK